MTNAIATLTGILTTVLTWSGLAVSLSEISITISVFLAGIAELTELILTAVGVGSVSLNKKITKHEKRTQ